MEILNLEEFKTKVEENKKLVLVDFYADWCGPCKMLAPILSQVNAECANFMDVKKVNIDNNFELAKNFSVMSIPTLVFMKDGKEVNRVVGFKSKEDIVEIAESLK